MNVITKGFKMIQYREKYPIIKVKIKEILPPIKINCQRCNHDNVIVEVNKQNASCLYCGLLFDIK
jgi:transcription elongation factor Elf1